jgi:glycine cleavage system H protein
MSYPTNLQYTKEHEWVMLEGQTATVGITDFAQQQLGDVVYVDLPEVGATVEAGQNFGTIESVKAVSDLYAPVTGTVTEVNTALKDSPQDLNQRPHDAWMIKVSLADGGAMVDLMDAAAYAEVAK